MRIFLDANVIFSASNISSNTNRFIRLLNNNNELITSYYAGSEAYRNIIRKRPEWESELGEITKLILHVNDIPLLEDIILAEKDRPILGSAIAAKCDYLVTGDKKDFGHLYNQTICGVMIVDLLKMASITLDNQI